MAQHHKEKLEVVIPRKKKAGVMPKKKQAPVSKKLVKHFKKREY